MCACYLVKIILTIISLKRCELVGKQKGRSLLGFVCLFRLISFFLYNTSNFILFFRLIWPVHRSLTDIRQSTEAKLAEHPLETRVTIRLIVLLLKGALIQLLQAVAADEVFWMELAC